tara:strand:+ start:1645 stop:1827 length:183 start_codon:yes stop_codon:yes gene_type:complete
MEKDNLKKILELTKKYSEKFISNKINIGEDLIQPSGKFINHEEISHIVESALDSWPISLT